MSMYYSPGDYGLKLIGSYDYSDGSYCFDYRAVWADEKGRLFTARDSGCSCPSPFEDYHSVKDLDRLTAWKTLEEEKRKESYDHGSITEWDEFKSSVKSALRSLREGK